MMWKKIWYYIYFSCNKIYNFFGYQFIPFNSHFEHIITYQPEFIVLKVHVLGPGSILLLLSCSYFI